MAASAPNWLPALLHCDLVGGWAGTLPMEAVPAAHRPLAGWSERSVQDRDSLARFQAWTDWVRAGRCCHLRQVLKAVVTCAAAVSPVR